MLPQEKIDEVVRLLNEKKLSQRMISKMTGVSRIVIHRIETGKRKIRLPVKPPEWDADRYKRPFERCPVCGGKVQLPCIGCVVRSLRKDGEYQHDNESTLRLELEDEHRKRYLKIKQWRERQKNPDFTELPEDWPFAKRKTSP